MGHWPIDALSWDRHSQQLHSTHATVVSPCHPRWCGQRLAELPAHWLPGSRRSGSITMLMWPGVSLPCAARWLRGIYHTSMPRTSPVGEWDHWPIDALSWDRHSQQLHSTHATVVSPCHPRWCGQRLSELPAHCLPGSRRSGSMTMLLWPGVSLPCAARWLRH